MTPNNMSEHATCSWILARLEAPKAKPVLRTDLYDTHSLHCPSCDSTALAELDWDVRLNMLNDPQVEQDGTVSVLVHQAQSEYDDRAWVCVDCDQVLDMSDVHTYWG